MQEWKELPDKRIKGLLSILLQVCDTSAEHASVSSLRSETEFVALLVYCNGDAAVSARKTGHTPNPALAAYVVEEVITQEDLNNETERRSMCFSCISCVCGNEESLWGM